MPARIGAVRVAIAAVLAIAWPCLPELLVFDDISSALDVDTEASLWDGLFARRDVSCLVVSHRRPVLQRADRVVLLEDGAVVAEGPLDELLETEPRMRALWEAESDGNQALR